MVVWEDRGVLKPPKPPIVHATEHTGWEQSYYKKTIPCGSQLHNYASRSMSETEQRYAQIEKEALAIT